MDKEEREELKSRQEEARRRALAREIRADFAARQAVRRRLERGWQLNRKFVAGDQFCDITPDGELEEEDNDFYWQARRAFNHIAPVVESRLARLAKIRPKLRVQAASDSEADVKTARLCSGILQAVRERTDLDDVIARATLWSETCGTAFYKVVWSSAEGAVVGTDERGRAVREGDVSVVALSPFEIYPDSLSAETMEEVRSLIHAKAVPVSEIYERFGVQLPGREIASIALASPCSSDGERPETGENMEILIERYTRPNGRYPAGRLEIAAGDTLLYEGDLPYRNGERGERVLPFVRQTCLQRAGQFFGGAVVDRLIPLQRAYNAVRNRKHEFLNRIAMGVITVEDGSLDAEELSEDGLYPGRVLVYRQGSSAPAMLDCGSLPAEFAEEEERISNEFTLVSGISEITRDSSMRYSVTSATGLQLILEQDTNRMRTSVESVERAVRQIGRQILHLYKQFSSASRLLRMTGTGGHTELYYFNESDISADDVVFEAGYERTAEDVKEEILSLLSLGLLKEADGSLSDATRHKVLDALGCGSFENARDVSALHIRKAERENVLLAQREVEADVYDDHELHITEHTRALLSGGEEDSATKARIMRHLESHRRKGA